mgnify:FL=1
MLPQAAEQPPQPLPPLDPLHPLQVLVQVAAQSPEQAPRQELEEAVMPSVP